MNGRSISVFLLDGHEVVRRGLRDVLERERDIVVVGSAATAAEGVREVPLTRPDVLVLDARLPDGDGVQVCRRVRAAVPGIRVLVLTSDEDDATLFAAIAAGASGFLLKRLRGNDIVNAVRKIAAGESLLDGRVVGAVMARLRSAPRNAAEVESLTERERRILDLIGEGLSNRQIAERMHLAEKTVKNHVTRILAKLGLERRAQAAVLASRLG